MFMASHSQHLSFLASCPYGSALIIKELVRLNSNPCSRLIFFRTQVGVQGIYELLAYYLFIYSRAKPSLYLGGIYNRRCEYCKSEGLSLITSIIRGSLECVYLVKLFLIERGCWCRYTAIDLGLMYSTCKQGGLLTAFLHILEKVILNAPLIKLSLYETLIDG